MERQASLTTGRVGPMLLKMCAAMVMGMFAMVAFHFADTCFVAQLGTRELAAISFTFPVVMLVGSIALGLGMGAGAVISRAIGQGDYRSVRRLTTDSLSLAVLVVAVFVAIGLVTIGPMFRLLGAGPDLLPLIRQYMTVWYLGMAFVVVPMVGNNAIRATGDMTIPSLIMITGAGINVVLDPLLIFGLLGFPRLGLLGAAVATVISRATTLTVALLVLHFRKRLLASPFAPLGEVWDSWKRVLYIGVPCAATNLLVPLSIGVVTAMAARFGPVAVAALGAGTRVGALSLTVLRALGAALVPFVGQNWGAGHIDRVRRAQVFSYLFSLAWGLVCVGVFVVGARPIARLFSRDPVVIGHIVCYLWIVPLGYGLQGVSRLVSVTLNALGRPLSAALLNAVRMFVLLVPLTYLGTHLFAVNGLFGGIALANVLAGMVALAWARYVHPQQPEPTVPVCPGRLGDDGG